MSYRILNVALHSSVAGTKVTSCSGRTDNLRNETYLFKFVYGHWQTRLVAVWCTLGFLVGARYKWASVTVSVSDAEWLWCDVWLVRLLKQLENAGSWRDAAVQFVNSVTTLMQRLLHYRYLHSTANSRVSSFNSDLRGELGLAISPVVFSFNFSEKNLWISRTRIYVLPATQLTVFRN